MRLQHGVTRGQNLLRRRMFANDSMRGSLHLGADRVGRFTVCLLLQRTLAFGPLRDLPVLEKQAPQVASHGGNGVARGAGLEVEERFLFDGVQGARDDCVVDEGIQYAFPVDSDAAGAASAFPDLAVMEAQSAADVAIGHSCVEEGFFERGHPAGSLVRATAIPASRSSARRSELSRLAHRPAERVWKDASTSSRPRSIARQGEPGPD
jgi:hypothetical protein